MSLFRRRRDARAGPPDEGGAGSREQPPPSDQHAAGEPPSAGEHGPSAGELLVGAYVTDGSSLFRVAQTIADGRTGNLLVELEDCRTYEVIICSAAALSDLRLAEVKPQHVG